MRFHLIVWSALAALTWAKTADYYFNICNQMVSKNMAIMKTCPRTPPVDTMYARYYQCVCQNEDIARTMLQCVSTFAEKLGGNEKYIRDSYASFTPTCMHFAKSPPKFSLDQVLSSLKSDPITQTYVEANTTKTLPFLLPETFFNEARIKTGLDYHFQRWACHAYGQASLGFIFGMVFLQIVVNFMCWLVPSLLRAASNNPVGRFVRAHLVLPALFGRRRAEPLVIGRYFYLCFPPRLHSVLIAGFTIMTVTMLSYHYPHIDGNVMFPTRKLYVAENIAYRGGVMGMYLVPALWLFAGRNNFLIWATGWQFEVFNHWHRWLARIFTLEIILHAAGWSVEEKMSKNYYEAFKEAWFYWGVIALVLMAFLCFNGTKSIRAPGYDLFLLLHILGAVFVVVGMWYHLAYVTLCQEQLYAAIAVWAFDRAARACRIMFANPLMSRAEMIAHGDDVFELTVHYSQMWKPKAGTYVFIHFMDPLRFWQAHPFTVIKPAKEDEDGTLKLYAKARGGITRHLYNKVVAEGRPLTKRIWLEGPYGVEFNIKPFSETLLVAGGIGITAVYSHLIGLADTVQDHTFFVHWVVRDTQPLAWFAHELEKMKTLANVQVCVWVSSGAQDATDEVSGPGAVDGANAAGISEASDAASFGSAGGVVTHDTKGSADTSRDSATKPEDIGKHGELVRRTSASSTGSLTVAYARPSVTDVVQGHIRDSRGPLCVFVCGPAGMGDDVRHACATGLNLTKNYVQFYEESFTM